MNKFAATIIRIILQWRTLVSFPDICYSTFTSIHPLIVPAYIASSFSQNNISIFVGFSIDLARVSKANLSHSLSVPLVGVISSHAGFGVPCICNSWSFIEKVLSGVMLIRAQSIIHGRMSLTTYLPAPGITK